MYTIKAFYLLNVSTFCNFQKRGRETSPCLRTSRVSAKVNPLFITSLVSLKYLEQLYSHKRLPRTA